MLFKTHENFNPQNINLVPRRIFKTILWLCSPWPSNVYWRFPKHVSILQTYKKRTILVVEKFSLQKIDRCQDFVAYFYYFSIKWENKHVYCEQWTQRLHIISQRTHTHTHPHSNTHYIRIYIYIYEYMYSEIITLCLKEISVSAMWSCR